MSKAYNPQDAYFRKAQAEGYRARSVYKLKEIDEKFKLFKKNDTVLDLGCTPGSWSQYLVEKCKTIIGVDLQETEDIDGAHFFQVDARSPEFEAILEREKIKKFDAIVSDMAPNTTGTMDIDQYASVELNLFALEIMEKHLKSGGWGVFKIFRGEDFNDFWLEAKKIFPNMKTFKPQACRDRSYEIYCIGKKK